jgi:hypothetical protein
MQLISIAAALGVVSSLIGSGAAQTFSFANARQAINPSKLAATLKVLSRKVAIFRHRHPVIDGEPGDYFNGIPSSPTLQFYPCAPVVVDLGDFIYNNTLQCARCLYPHHKHYKDWRF